MKIHLCSDLHLEFGNKYIPEIEADTIIVAGDITPNTAALKNYLTVLSNRYANVVFVLGNHDYYRHNIKEKELDLYNTFKASNVHLLQNDLIEIGRVSFYGGTMWTDGCGGNDSLLERNISDFHLIRGFSVKQMRELHAKFKENWRAADVVVSHHVPDSMFTADKFKGSNLNGAFSCSDMQEYLQQPKVWCFGHTHNRYDEVLGSTRFLCNPYGYPLEYTDFDDELVFEL